MKVDYKRSKSGLVSVAFKDMTQGEALSLSHALAIHAENSPVAEDLKVFLNYAIQRNGKTDQDQELLEALP